MYLKSVVIIFEVFWVGQSGLLMELSVGKVGVHTVYLVRVDANHFLLFLLGVHGTIALLDGA